MPLTEKVNFKKVAMGNRIQVPKLARWRYKLEGDQVLKVTVSVLGVLDSPKRFFARICIAGRIVIPKLLLDLFRLERPTLAGYVFDVTLEPS